MFNQFLLEMRMNKNEKLKRKLTRKKIVELCKKTKVCPWCGEINGIVKSKGTKITHHKFNKKKHHEEIEQWHQEFENAIDGISEVKTHLSKMQEDFNPITVLNLFKRINDLVKKKHRFGFFHFLIFPFFFFFRIVRFWICL